MNDMKYFYLFSLVILVSITSFALEPSQTIVPNTIEVSKWCKMDGTSDETLALRKAIDYCTKNNTKLIWNSGTYRVRGNITSSISIKSTALNIEFGSHVKIVVTGTDKFDYPNNRILFFYGTASQPHSFSMTGGQVEIDGANMIQCAICISQPENLNPS